MFEISWQDDIAIVEMQHGKVNAIDLDFCTSLIDTLDDIESTTACRAMIIGSRLPVFSAGIDLKHWLDAGPEYVEPLLVQLESLFAKTLGLAKPVVAHIGGPAIAGGCMLALACDYRVIAQSARIGILESRLGVPLPITAVEILRHVATASTFRSIVNLGAMFSGNDAVRAGLADRATDDNEAAAVALSVARELGTLPAETFQWTKQQRIEPVLRQIAANRELLFDRYLEIWKSPETESAIRCYVENRLN